MVHIIPWISAIWEQSASVKPGNLGLARSSVGVQGLLGQKKHVGYNLASSPWVCTCATPKFTWTFVRGKRGSCGLNSQIGANNSGNTKFSSFTAYFFANAEIK